MAFMVCFFPIVLSTATGLTTTPADLAELARSMDASRFQTFRRVRLPAALPQIFVGLKVAMPLAVIGVVVGEMQYGESGLGMIIVQTGGQATRRRRSPRSAAGGGQHRALLRARGDRAVGTAVGAGDHLPALTPTRRVVLR